jgi:hypothetical protein
MEQETNATETSSKDVLSNWVSTSRFIFYVYIAVTLAFIFGMCYGLYTHRYKGKPNVEVNSSSLYSPVYH